MYVINRHVSTRHKLKDPMAKQTLSMTGLIRLREPTFYILLSLAQEKKHGYAILREVEALSGGRVRLSTGTLYGALGRLLTQGVVERVTEEALEVKGESTPVEDGVEETGSSRQRKCYQLTPFGRRVLEGEIAHMQALLSIAWRQLGREPL